ncbi:MAG: lactate utilization protein C [Firmicutes bacterium HGW-Firmicutes-12]|nr:MAG: lactate utilization protein C [Firmicutes bacterium HGW-Firmicutes-12]
MPKNWHNEILGGKVVDALTKNNFKAVYVATKEEATKKVLELIEDSKSIGLGTSMTVNEMGALEEIRKSGKEIFDHSDPSLSAEEKFGMRIKQQTCDCFISSTNAVTLDGKLVNVDGSGNRVSAMIFGPKKVIVIAGVNKIAKDVDAAMDRIECYAAPMNNKRINFPNPCIKSGVCMDCSGSTRICNVTTIIRKKPTATDINVIIVGEDLGY